MKWRKIETEGLPPDEKEVLWWHKNKYCRLGKLYNKEKVYWDERWVTVKAFTHWAPLPPPPKD